MIRIFNTFIRIEDFSPSSANGKKLQRYLSHFDENTFSVTFTAFKPFYTKDGITCIDIPRAFGIARVNKLFPDKEVKFMKRDNSLGKKEIFKMTKSPLKHQESAVKWLEETQQKSPQLTLHLRTGDGKTYLTLNYIQYLGKKALIIVHNNNVAEQWKLRIQEFTDIKKEEICIVKRQQLDKIMEKQEKYKIYLVIHRTCRNIIEESDGRLHAFLKKCNIEVKAIDEVHKEFKNIALIDIRSNTPNNLYLTATLGGKLNWRENNLMQNIIPRKYIFGKGAEDIKKEERTFKVYSIEYNTGASQVTDLSFKSRNGFNINKWADYFTERKRFFADMLIHYITKVDKHNKYNHAIVLRKIDQCKAIQELLEVYFNEPIGNFTGAVSKAKRRDELKHRIFVTTKDSFGEAMDTDIDFLHNFYPMAGKDITLQLLGRLRKHRKSKMLDYYDSSISGIAAMASKRMAIYRKVSKKIYEFKYSSK